MNEDHLKIENQLWKLMKYDIMQKLIDQMNPDQKNEIQELSEKLTKIDENKIFLIIFICSIFTSKNHQKTSVH